MPDPKTKSLSPSLKRLQFDFSAFRRTRSGRCRIPMALKDAALEAIDTGIPSAKVAKACGLSSSQLWTWRKQRSAGMVPATVLTVFDEPSVQPARLPQDIELQLQIGGWRLRLRLDPPASEST